MFSKKNVEFRVFPCLGCDPRACFQGIYLLLRIRSSFHKERKYTSVWALDWLDKKKLHLVTHLRENQQCFPNTYYVLHFILLLRRPKEGERRGPSRGPVTVTVPLSDGAWIDQALPCLTELILTNNSLVELVSWTGEKGICREELKVLHAFYRKLGKFRKLSHHPFSFLN